MTTDSEVWSLRHKESRKKVSLTLIISFCLRVNEHSSLTVQCDIISVTIKTYVVGKR